MPAAFFTILPNLKDPIWCCLLGLVCCTGIMGCEDEKEKIIAEKVGERVLAFQLKEQAECQQGLVARAERIVDSLLLVEAQQALQDSLSRLRPFRPIQPPPVPPIDSSAIVPWYKGPPKQ